MRQAPTRTHTYTHGKLELAPTRQARVGHGQESSQAGRGGQQEGERGYRGA